jgi:aminoglycoside phosphotransferase (APT) family kinase protein
MQQLPTHDQFLERFYDPVWLGIGHALFAREGLSVGRIIRSEQGESVVLVGDNRYVLKIYRPWKRGFERESTALEKLIGKLPVPIPEIVSAGELEGYRYLITTAIPGRMMTRPEWLALDRKTQVDLICQLADFLRTLHALPIEETVSDWPGFIARNAAGAVDRQRREGGNPEWIESLPAYIDRNLPLVQTAPPYVFLHGDVHFGNLRFNEENGRLKISGVFDFADSLIGSQEYDFIAPGVLMIQGQGDLQREFFRRYGYAEGHINEEMRRRMMMLTILYEFSSLRRYAERLSPEAVHLSLEELEKAIWSFA